MPTYLLFEQCERSESTIAADKRNGDILPKVGSWVSFANEATMPSECWTFYRPVAPPSWIMRGCEIHEATHVYCDGGFHPIHDESHRTSLHTCQPKPKTVRITPVEAAKESPSWEAEFDKRFVATSQFGARIAAINPESIKQFVREQIEAALAGEGAK